MSVPARMADLRASHFNVARRREVPVKRESFAKSSSSHDFKAHCVDKRILTFVVPTQPAPGLVFDVRRHMDHSHTWGSLQCIEKAHCYSVPCPSTQESPGFPDDVIAAQQQALVFAPNPSCFGVVLIAGHQQSDPEGSVNESYLP